MNPTNSKTNQMKFNQTSNVGGGRGLCIPVGFGLVSPRFLYIGNKILLKERKNERI